MSLTSKDGSQPEEMDIFVTLRHIDVDGQEGELKKLCDTRGPLLCF